ncbi:hypothetical protein NX862_03200 [Rhodobacter sp. KR11]|uniref:calcium-binding protein n=1 Tax=Rhodobacter sp. KR11 TaxID=2974588 RepID=UPI002221A0FC|nr:hypothetical protein [Rhodobacter sp. KR11]MCW1917747.1 hypothetical protein [Rhodobacter sp. KR11]
MTNLVIDRLEAQGLAGLSFALDHGAALAAMDLQGPGRALQVSAGGVRLQWGDYEVRVAAYGIGPISKAGQLQAALDRALATGLIPVVSTLQGGVGILDIVMMPNGMTLNSGAQSLTLIGAPPASFAALRALQNLGLQADRIDTMTAEERAAWLTALADHGMTGLGLRHDGQLVFAYRLTEDSATLQLGDLRLVLTGHFTGFADVAGRMAAVLTGFQLTGRLELSGLAGLAPESLRLADAEGTTLLRVTDWDLGGAGFSLGGRDYGEWLGLRGAGSQVLVGAAGAVASLLTGYGGDDRLLGLAGDDGLYGGTGHDTLNGGMGDDLIFGGAGKDTAVFTGTAPLRVDLRLTEAQATGQGSDVLQGIENVIGAQGADWLHGNRVGNLLMGLQGNDTLDGGFGRDTLIGGMGQDVLIGGPGDDRLEGGAQDDTLTGGEGADVFVFGVSGGQLPGMDVITDFQSGDRLALVLPVPSGLTSAQVVAMFGVMVAGHAELHFAPGQGVVFQGVSSLAGLVDALIL